MSVTMHAPAVIDPATGLPRSWAHYVIALRSVNRERARRTLDAFSAAKMAAAGEKAQHHVSQWVDSNKHAAGEG